MCRLRISLILLLAGFATTQARYHQNDRKVDPHRPEYVNLLFISTTLLIGCIIRTIVIKYNIPTPFSAFVALVGFAWGAIAYQSQFARKLTQVVYMSPHEILYLYTPVLMFSMSFSVDIGILGKILPQVLVLGFPVTLLTAVVFGYLMRLIIDPAWVVAGGLVFGIFCCPIFPGAVVYLLKDNTETRSTSVLLQTEALFGLIIANIAHNLMLSHFLGYVVHWYQYLMVSLRFLIFGKILSGAILWGLLYMEYFLPGYFDGVQFNHVQILLGLLVGYIMGLLGRYLFRKMYTNSVSIFGIAFALPFFTYALSDTYFSGCGSLSVAVIGIMMSSERAALSKEIDTFLDDFWKMTSFVFDTVLCMTCSVEFMMDLVPLFSWTSYILVIMTYVLYYAVRFSCFLLFSPVISRLGYGMDLKNLIVCVWCGMKCPFSVILARVFIDFDVRSEQSSIWYFYIMGLYILSLFINGTFTRTIMDFLNLRNISLARRMNMNNCIKHIFVKRERTIAILKMDRFLADTNWPMVIEATNMQHPYHVELEEDEDAFYFGQNIANCPDCHKQIQQELTSRELKEMTREANLRVLKAKKMSYSRQFENGMISKAAIRILTQAVDLAADSPKAVIELDGLEKRFTQKDTITRFLHSRVRDLNKFNKATSIRPPRKYFRRFCYNIVVNDTWEKIMCYVCLCNCVLLLVDFIFVHGLKQKHEVVGYIIFAFEVIFCAIYVIEFVMKILAYSWLYIWKHGVQTYFKSLWNIIDFIVIVAYIFHTLHDFQDISSVTVTTDSVLKFVIDILVWLRVIRLLRLFGIFYPKLIRYLERNVDSKTAFTYELGKSYTIGETEVLDLLPYMIDNIEIREEIKQKLERDKVIITKLLGIVQKEKPWIAITVKTKQAIRTVLKSMNEAMKQLKISGWVDDYEQKKLAIEMGQQYKKVNAIKTVKPSAPKVIFKEVAWMAGEKDVIDFLFENVTVKTFEAGDVAYGEGTVADGIYIVVTGLFMILYEPQKSLLDSLREYGTLPIVDYLSSTKFEESSLDYIVSGNCVGELSTLTRRAYNCTITADVHSQVYVLSYNVLRRAMELSPDPVIGLECRIWKEVSIRIAVQLLLSVPAYQNYSQDQIKYTLERAFVPNLSDYKIFAVSEMVQDIILIEGVAADFITRDIFIAPCCIPRRVQKLILPNSSLMNIPINLETKLLIIPERDLDEYDVMTTAEETGEMVAIGSATKCLHHTVQERARQRRRMRMATSSKHVKKKAGESMVVGNRGSVPYAKTLPEPESIEMHEKRKMNNDERYSDSTV